MRKKRIVLCNSGSCPAFYLSGEWFLVQGYKVSHGERRQIGYPVADDEDVVMVPRELLRKIFRAATESDLFEIPLILISDGWDYVLDPDRTIRFQRRSTVWIGKGETTQKEAAFLCRLAFSAMRSKRLERVKKYLYVALLVKLGVPFQLFRGLRTTN